MRSLKEQIMSMIYVFPPFFFLIFLNVAVAFHRGERSIYDSILFFTVFIVSTLLTYYRVKSMIINRRKVEWK